MRNLKVPDKTDTIHNFIIFSPDEYQFKKIEWLKQTKNQKTSVYYLNGIFTFDIETSTVEVGWNKKKHKEDNISFMYVWQFYINGDVVVGRTYSELIDFFNRFIEFYGLDKNHKAMIFIHNLSYEYQFLKKVLDTTNVFAISERQILKWECSECLEFRCSYMLTGVSLKKWSEDSFINFAKLELNYSEVRYPSDRLSDNELAYMIVDVLILADGIKHRLKNDNFYTLPLTKTGYVRRRFRNICKNDKEWMKFYNSQKLTVSDYISYRQAFMGGQVRLNPRCTGEKIDCVGSADITSSYPYELLSKEFPDGQPLEVANPDVFDLSRLQKTDKLFLIDIELINVKKNEFKFAFIQFSNLLSCSKNCRKDNGRIITAEYLRICCTNIDFEIIQNHYDFDILKINKILVHPRKKLLPWCFREEALKLYSDKTKLKGIEEKADKYNLSKSDINALYGMTVTSMIREDINFVGDDFFPNKEKLTDEIIESKIKKFYKSKNNFLPYSIGVFVTAYARQHLIRLIDKVGTDFVYCDTDCVKFINPEKNLIFFDEDNEKVLNELSQIYTEYEYAPCDIHGVKHPLGCWDFEGIYSFKGFGSKKYVTAKDEKEQITIAGCNKKAKDYFNTVFDIELGVEIPSEFSGRTSSEYIDETKKIDTPTGKLIVPSCLNINDVSYTLGITEEHRIYSMLEKIKYIMKG